MLSIDDATYGTGIDQVNYGGTGATTKTGTGWGTVVGTTLVGADQATVTNSTTANNTATIMFNGRILFYAGYKNSRGHRAVSIDGGPETFIDLYANHGVGFSARCIPVRC